jgi:hypothetical protein
MKNLFLSFLICSAFVPSFVHAQTLSDRLSGRILLQVESHGEAWYVNPLNGYRYSLGRPDDAWNLMRSLGLGISNKDLGRALPSRLSGRILLAVESHGEAYYVDPLTLKPFYLGRPADAFNLMRRMGLGITNANLAQIPMASSASNNNSQPATTITNLVPFTAQAPFGDWSDPRQQDGCEESSALMAVAWARGEALSLTDARDSIIAMSDWEKKMYGTFEDTSVQDTADRILGEYLKFTKSEVKKNIGTEDILQALQDGKIVITAVNGQKLHNPNFVAGGPLRHMILITGYDAGTKSFITHDPGTRAGANYHYPATTIAGALMDYPSGNHAPLVAMPTGMIMVSKE